ncbi:MAG: hypothetical protein MJE68_00920 [Proteobacteria bacterium]|nr:hypothetical protein [Pseudomonadota bacterium]
MEIESDQDKNNDIIVIVTKQKTFYVPRNVAAADYHLRVRGRPPNHAEQHRLQWSVEETCKFASAEVVPSKI